MSNKDKFFKQKEKCNWEIIKKYIRRLKMIDEYPMNNECDDGRIQTTSDGYHLSAGEITTQADMMHMRDSIPKREKQINKELDILDKSVTCLEKNIEVLKDVLINSICRNIQPLKSNKKEVEQVLVPLALKIKVMTKRITQVNNKIDNVGEGLEV